MRRVKLIILFFSVALLTGCWNYRELEELAIVGAIGIDIKDNEFNVSVEVINPKMVGGQTQTGGGSSDEAVVVVYEATSKTIREALAKMVLESPKRLYVGHMNLLVISEEVAKNGIRDLIDYFIRDTEVRKVYTTVVVKNGKAADALKILQPLESITAANIRSNLESLDQYYSSANNATFDEIIMCLYTDGCHPTIASIEIIGNPKEGEKTDNLSSTKPNTSIKVSGSAVFKGDKLINYLNEDENIYYLMIRDKVASTYLSFPCDDNENYGNIVIDGLKSDMKVTLKKNKPKVTMNFTGKATLTEYNCKTNLRKEKNLKTIENIVNKEMEKNINKTISKMQDLNSDIFGFGEQLYRNNYSYWKKNKKKWDTIFPSIDYKVNSTIKIKRISSTNNAAKNG